MTTIGILGAGQLGRMLALAGFPLGMQFNFYSQQQNSATNNLGRHFGADQSSLQSFLNDVQVVTYETENTPLNLAEQVAQTHALMPGIQSLKFSQHRFHEKSLFAQLGIPSVPFQVIQSQTELQAAIDKLGLPIILKTLTDGYDGKGQAIIRSEDEISTTWRQFDGKPVMAEAFMDFDYEVSQIAVRDQHQQILFYPLSHNLHQNGILQFSLVNDALNHSTLHEQAKKYITQLMEELDHIGVFTLEFFVKNQKLFANEMAPRVHNSGHWTMNGAVTCQFENHLRAIASLPLGSTEMAYPHNLMINLIGEIPEAKRLLGINHLHLHDYAKEPRSGRKVGHLNINTHCDDALEKAISELPANLSQALKDCSRFFQS